MTNTEIKSKKKLNLKTLLPIIVIGIVLLVYAVSIFVPLVWGLVTSFKSHRDFATWNNVLGFPNPKYSAAEMKFSNYKFVLENFVVSNRVAYYFGNKQIVNRCNDGILNLFINTLLYAGVGCVLQGFVPAIVGYMCAKYPCKFSSIVYYVTLFSMAIPVVGNYPATINVLRSLHLYDEFYGNFVQQFNFSGMYFFVFYAYFKGMPNAYMEAAEIDGASQFYTLTRIVLPLAIKMIGSVMLIKFVALWNDYQTPLLYLPTHPTLAYGVYNISTRTDGDFTRIPVKIAAFMILAIPILVVYSVLKNKIVGNMSMGGIKE